MTNLIKNSLVKEFFHELGMSVSADTYDKIDENLKKDLEIIALRTKSNKRVTVKPYDC